MAISIRFRERIRTGVITGLMFVSLLTIGLLTHQTYIAVTSQQDLVNDVLRDYSNLAADEFLRRSTGVAIYGFYPLLGRLSQVPRDSELPDRQVFFRKIVAEARQEEQATLREAINLAKALFRYFPDTQRFDFQGQALPEAVREGLRAELRSIGSFMESPEKGVRTFHSVQEGQHYNFVYATVDVGDLEDRYVIGLWIDNEVALDWIRYFVSLGPLLPGSLTEGKLSNDSVFIDVSVGSESVYRNGTYQPDSLVVTRAFKDEPVIYGGMVLKLSLDPDVADSLIIGGLPARLPIIYGSTASVLGTLWVVALLLMLIALAMLWRERSLAHLRADFVSRVSHELRTPLAQIIMFAQTLLLDRVRTDEERRRSLEVIDKEAQRLSHLVDNILQFSRAERGRSDIRMVRQPLGPLVREIADQFRPMMKAGRLIFSSDVGDDLEVELDVDAFRQMFVNLLDNAVKYSPDGEDVDILLSTSDGRVNVAVEDRGPGVPESEQRRIWEPYYRTHAEGQEATGGTGIGLAVVNELARLQAAYVSMTERNGGGSRFVIGFDIVQRATA